MCKLKFIKRQINKPKICVLLSKAIISTYIDICAIKKALKICLALSTSQNQKLINMETKILSRAVNFKPLFRHFHHLN